MPRRDLALAPELALWLKRPDATAAAGYLTETQADALYRLPVGTVFLTIGNTNPGTLLGYGTWALRASGLTLVGA